MLLVAIHTVHLVTITSLVLYIRYESRIDDAKNAKSTDTYDKLNGFRKFGFRERLSEIAILTEIFSIHGLDSHFIMLQISLPSRNAYLSIVSNVRYMHPVLIRILDTAGTAKLIVVERIHFFPGRVLRFLQHQSQLISSHLYNLMGRCSVRSSQYVWEMEFCGIHDNKKNQRNKLVGKPHQMRKAS